MDKFLQPPKVPSKTGNSHLGNAKQERKEARVSAGVSDFLWINLHEDTWRFITVRNLGKMGIRDRGMKKQNKLIGKTVAFGNWEQCPFPERWNSGEARAFHPSFPSGTFGTTRNTSEYAAACLFPVLPSDQYFPPRQSSDEFSLYSSYRILETQKGRNYSIIPLSGIIQIGKRNHPINCRRCLVTGLTVKRYVLY